MSAQKRSAVAALALVGAVVLSGLTFGAMAQTDPGTDSGTGPGGPDRAAKLIEMFGTIDADADGKITQPEITAHRAAQFAAADSNGDGNLDQNELAARELARFTKSLADRTARMLKREDANGNGTLQADEIGAGPLEDRFARIDTDDDGALSKAEIETAVERLAERDGKRKHGQKDGWFN